LFALGLISNEAKIFELISVGKNVNDDVAQELIKPNKLIYSIKRKYLNEILCIMNSSVGVS